MRVLVICILYSDWVFLNLTEIFLTLTEVFPCFFLSCKANARVKIAKTGHCPHSSTLVVICVVRLLFVLFCVLFVCKCVLPPGDNPIAVNTYININIFQCVRILHRTHGVVGSNPVSIALIINQIFSLFSSVPVGKGTNKKNNYTMIASFHIRSI